MNQQRIDLQERDDAVVFGQNAVGLIRRVAVMIIVYGLQILADYPPRHLERFHRLLN